MRKIRAGGYAVTVSYRHRTRRVVVLLSTGIYLSFPPRAVLGLGGASAKDLSQIEISAAGLGLHWPALDVDLYVPGLLGGDLGCRSSRAPGAGCLARRTVNGRAHLSRNRPARIRP